MGVTVTGRFNKQVGVIKVKNNLPPAWDTPVGSLGSSHESEPINYSVSATDPIGDTVQYYFHKGTLPLGSSINPSTGVISGPAVSVSENTQYDFTINATDGSANVRRAFTINVTNNLAPSWVTPIGDLGSYTVNNPVSIQLSATDGDGLPSTISYSLVSGTLPTGITMDSAGLISGSTSVAGNVLFTVRATDGLDFNDRQFSLTIEAQSTIQSSSSEWEGATSSFTFTGSNITAPTNESLAIRSVTDFTGDFLIEFSWGTEYPATVLLAPSTTTFNQNQQVSSIKSAGLIIYDPIFAGSYYTEVEYGGIFVTGNNYTGLISIERVGNTITLKHNSTILHTYTESNSLKLFIGGFDSGGEITIINGLQWTI